MPLCSASDLTKRSTWFVSELAFFVSFLNGIKECRHVLSKTPQPIGPTALHCLQVPFVGFNAPHKHVILFPKNMEIWVF